MRFFFHRACARAMRIVAIVCVLAFSGTTVAHEGHDHGIETPAAATVPSSPRVVATSETYQFVGIVEGEVLVIYLDRAADNSPITTARIELTLDGGPVKVEPNKRDGTYEATSELLRETGSHEVLVTLSEGDTNDLLVGALLIPARKDSAEGAGSGLWHMLAKRFGVSEASGAYAFWNLRKNVAGEVIDNAYTTHEEVHVAPTGPPGETSQHMTGTKSVSGTPTAAGSAAGCQPFEMRYDVAMTTA